MLMLLGGRVWRACIRLMMGRMVLPVVAFVDLGPEESWPFCGGVFSGGGDGERAGKQRKSAIMK